MSEKGVVKFLFSQGNNEAVSLTVEEAVSKDYHSFVWPSGVVLGQFISSWFLRNKEKVLSLGKALVVLEIGAGCSLPSLLFNKLLMPCQNECRPRSIASDGHKWFALFKEQLLRNCEANSIVSKQLEFYPISWGRFPSDLPEDVISAQSKLLLCSDCFYDTKDFEDVIMTISYLLHGGRLEKAKSSLFAECWCTIQLRSANHSIAHLLEKWKMTYERIPLHTFDAQHSSLAGSHLPGRSTIEMYIFKCY